MLRIVVCVLGVCLFGCSSCSDHSNDHQVENKFKKIKEIARPGRDYESAKAELEERGFELGEPEPYPGTEREDLRIVQIALVEELPPSVIFDMTVGRPSDKRLAATIFIDDDGIIKEVK